MVHTYYALPEANKFLNEKDNKTWTSNDNEKHRTEHDGQSAKRRGRQKVDGVGDGKQCCRLQSESVERIEHRQGKPKEPSMTQPRRTTCTGALLGNVVPAVGAGLLQRHCAPRLPLLLLLKHTSMLGHMFEHVRAFVSFSL